MCTVQLLDRCLKTSLVIEFNHSLQFTVSLCGISLCKLIRKQEEKNVSTIFISSIFLKPNPMKNVLDNPTFSVIEGNLAGELTTDKKPEKNHLKYHKNNVKIK